MNEKSFKKLTPRAIYAWQWGNAFGNLFYFLIPALYFIFFFNSLNWVIFIALCTIVFAGWLASIVWLPFAQWKRWRYSIDANEIDLFYGVLIHKKTLVPMNRVQHVDTRQGPLLRWYNLSSITISTAATTHVIPALDETVAERVRDQIATKARLAKDDV
ncbi:MAG: PH domain-containing protein [Balneolaceae bacterium]